jgi:leucyl aminopeptidase
MLLMKKDMGGAASALALAELIMAAKLKVHLRLLIPIVENSISGVSFRPGDIFKSRKGLTVEIGNTDAEGRLILADALTYACEEKPDLLIDMATLTGAARVALGPDLPPYYTDDETLARELEKSFTVEHDPLWRLPLYRRYAASLKSKNADLNNIGGSAFAGSIIAALFLAEFVNVKSWLHIDMMAWNPTSSPGRPEGGEAQSVRALFALLKNRFGAKS